MNAYISASLRQLTCGGAAALITLVLSVTFVHSTSLPPGAHAGAGVFVQMQPQGAWFGQPEPAVLVD
jgi:hypothetical protein